MRHCYYIALVLISSSLLACTQESRRSARRLETAAPRAAEATRPAPARLPSDAASRAADLPAEAARPIRRSRRAAPLAPLRAAAIPPVAEAPAVNGAAPAALPPSEELAVAEKAAQRFWVQPGRDTVLRCAEGTVLALPADAFVTDTTSGAVLKEPVELRVREFYSLPDILLQNLTTTSDGTLLATGGMVQLEARTASGKTCTVRPGAEIVLQMAAPARPFRAAMQLYTGTHDAPRHRVNWQRPRRALRPGL